MPSLRELVKQKLAEQKSTTIKQKPAKQEHTTNTLELDKLTIDEIRAQYIFICKKNPKHDKIQTKNFLIDKIIKKLNRSKTNKR
ncbi:hypothetical protein LCGC14_1898230 [marine sediment metagenome]|uniref:Uncharacterized protein n=1 Tax=marine sediment metagenome TaxID=412755 RepID=A0A0F9FXD9_9ZZZZ